MKVYISRTIQSETYLHKFLIIFVLLVSQRVHESRVFLMCKVQLEISNYYEWSIQAASVFFWQMKGEGGGGDATMLGLVIDK